MRFAEFVARRVLLAIVTLVGLSIIIFYLSRILPSNPGRLALGPFATAGQVAHYDHLLGIDRPLYIQYFLYVWNFLNGNWGLSLLSHHNVLSDVEYYFPGTFELITISIIATALIGVPLGVVAAAYRGRRTSALIRILWICGIAIPPFTIGIALQLMFGYFTNLLPITSQLSGPAPAHITGMYFVDSLLTANFPALVDSFKHLLLPEVALSLAGIGQIAQLTYAGMLDQTQEDYYLALKAFGAPSYPLNFRYALRTAMVPVLTVLGLLYASLIANAFLVEIVFAWGGLSQYAVAAMQNNDFNVIVATVLVIGVFYVTLNSLIDIGLGYIDPRIRLGEAK